MNCFRRPRIWAVSPFRGGVKRAKSAPDQGLPDSVHLQRAPLPSETLPGRPRVRRTTTSDARATLHVQGGQATGLHVQPLLRTSGAVSCAHALREPRPLAPCPFTLGAELPERRAGTAVQTSTQGFLRAVPQALHARQAPGHVVLVANDGCAEACTSVLTQAVSLVRTCWAPARPDVPPIDDAVTQHRLQQMPQSYFQRSLRFGRWAACRMPKVGMQPGTTERCPLTCCAAAESRRRLQRIQA